MFYHFRFFFGADCRLVDHVVFQAVSLEWAVLPNPVAAHFFLSVIIIVLLLSLDDFSIVVFNYFF